MRLAADRTFRPILPPLQGTLAGCIDPCLVGPYKFVSRTDRARSAVRSHAPSTSPRNPDGASLQSEGGFIEQGREHAVNTAGRDRLLPTARQVGGRRGTVARHYQLERRW